MAFMKKASKDFDVIIGLDSSVTGDIVSEGSVRIDGKISGSVKSKGDVIVGDNAVVEADIEAVFCEISGSVTGSVHSDTQLKIYKSGTLKGDIVVSSFTIEEGGIFQGNCDINPETRDRKPVDKKPNEEKHSQKNQQNQQKNNQNNHKNQHQNAKKTG